MPADWDAALEHPDQTKRLALEKYYLLLILALAFVSRGALLGVTWRSDSAALSPDSPSYLAPALSLATEGSFKTAQQPEIFRTPGYPAFLVASGFTGPLGYGITQIVQVLLDVLLIYLTFVLGVRLVSPTAGLWAAGFQACSLVAMLSSVKILSDGLFAFLMTAAILLLVRYFEERKLRRLIMAAAVIAAATYVRPVGFIFVPIVAVVFLFQQRRITRVAAFVLVFAALVAPWFVRNYLTVGYAGFSSVSDHNLLFYEAAGVWAKSHGLSTQEARQNLDMIYRQRLKVEEIELGSPQAMRVQRQMGLAILLAYPATFLRVHSATSLNSLLPAGTGLLEMLGVTSGNRGTLSVLHTAGLWAATKYYFGSNKTAMLLMVPELVFLVIQYLACSAYALRQLALRGVNWGPAAWLIVPTILAFVLVGGPAAVPRFRLPVEPLLNIAAGAGVAMLLKRRKPVRKRPTDLGPNAWTQSRDASVLPEMLAVKP
jgi:4-amino-4-deoxy-L-arabinose transferase-like glycosyltransferase